MFQAFVFHLLALFLSSSNLAVGEVARDVLPPISGYPSYAAPPPPVISGGYQTPAPPSEAEHTKKCPPAPVQCCNGPPPNPYVTNSPPNPYVTNSPPNPYVTNSPPYPYGKYPPSYPYGNYPSPPYPYQYVPSSAPSMFPPPFSMFPVLILLSTVLF